MLTLNRKLFFDFNLSQSFFYILILFGLSSLSSSAIHFLILQVCIGCLFPFWQTLNIMHRYTLSSLFEIFEIKKLLLNLWSIINLLIAWFISVSWIPLITRLLFYLWIFFLRSRWELSVLHFIFVYFIWLFHSYIFLFYKVLFTLLSKLRCLHTFWP